MWIGKYSTIGGLENHDKQPYASNLTSCSWFCTYLLTDCSTVLWNFGYYWFILTVFGQRPKPTSSDWRFQEPIFARRSRLSLAAWHWFGNWWLWFATSYIIWWRNRHFDIKSGADFAFSTKTYSHHDCQVCYISWNTVKPYYVTSVKLPNLPLTIIEIFWHLAMYLCCTLKFCHPCLLPWNVPVHTVAR